MKEYALENGELVDLKQLEGGFMDNEIYSAANAGLVNACHDVIVQYNDGALLVVRDNFPAKGILWPLGGRILRGIPAEESLRKKVKSESGLDLEDITYLDTARVFLQTDPFNHGKGSDAIALRYFAKGSGELSLDKLHREPTIITPQEFVKKRNEFHPYVQDIMDLAMCYLIFNS